MAIVKANGYGHGAIQVSKLAVDVGVDWFGVSFPEEGKELRKSGLWNGCYGADAFPRILVLAEPEKSLVLEIDKFALTPVVYTPEFIRCLSPGTPVHLKVDTGMHRLGCNPSEVSELVKLINDCGLVLEGFMTHLAGGPGGSDKNQLNLFNYVKGFLDSDLDVIVHAANSKAVMNGYAKYDMDRCGFAIYDGAMKLFSKISFTRFVKTMERVSYGGKYMIKTGSYLGVIPIGYADGLPTSLVGNTFKVGGEYVVVASVTMDQTILDLGKAHFPVGTEVDLCVSNWANWLDIIPYEIYTRIANRVPRIYTGT